MCLWRGALVAGIAALFARAFGWTDEFDMGLNMKRALVWAEWLARL
jgi:hypothetical protein